MAAGVSKTLWEIGDIVKLVEATEATLTKRGPYRPRPEMKRVLRNFSLLQ